MSVVDTVEILKGRELSDDEYFKAGVLGWSVELVSMLSLLHRDFSLLSGIV
jgi:farnesyl diphosphate synthase